MKRLLLLTAITLSACGGGGESGIGSPSTELEGTWIYASAGHPTGTLCGQDIHAANEVRSTIKFTANTITQTDETCVITSGVTGVFSTVASITGIFTIGDVYLTFGGESYKKLDITAFSNYYTGYYLSGSSLKFAGTSVGNDGSTDAKRLNNVGFAEQPVYAKQP